jgi:hypothetical protein
MEAYMFEGSESMRQTGRIDRMDANFAPLRAWWLQTGGGAKVPTEWFKAWPTIAIFEPDERPLTPWIGAGGYCVSEDVKGVIEELSPGVHQFIPLSVEAGPPSDRRTYQYYSLHVADRADEVLFERSEVEWYTVYATGGKNWRKIAEEPLVLPEQSIRGKHLWRNARCFMFCMSGELHDRLHALGLAEGLKFQKQIVEAE